MTRLFPVRYDKQKLSAVPEDERVLHFIMQRIANDVTMLHKLLIFYLQAPDDEPKVLRSARTAMALMLAQLLAGRLYEAWNILRGEQHSKTYKYYEPQLAPEANAALVEIKRYFNGADNLIHLVRKKLAFHIDVELFKVAYERFPEDEPMTDFLSQQVGNTYYEAASLLTALSIKQLSGESDFAVALDRLMGEVVKVGRWIMDYIYGFMVVFVLKHVDPNWTAVQSEAEEIAGPRLVDVHAPFFCEAGESDVNR